MVAAEPDPPTRAEPPPDLGAFLDARSGIPGPLPTVEMALAAQSHNQRAQTAEAVQNALTVTEAASRLGLSPSQVRRRIAGRRLHAFRVGQVLHLPLWQFIGPSALPHLPEVLQALPADLHHQSVTGFFTTPDDDLNSQTRAAWLAAGGDAGPVLLAAQSLHHW